MADRQTGRQDRQAVPAGHSVRPSTILLAGAMGCSPWHRYAQPPAPRQNSLHPCPLPCSAQRKERALQQAAIATALHLASQDGWFGCAS